MKTRSESEAIFVLEMLMHDVGVLDLTRWLVDYEGAGGEGVSCEFDEKKPCMLVAENLGEEEFERLFYLPGHKMAPQLENWVLEEVREDVDFAIRLRALSIQYLPAIFKTFGHPTLDFETDLDHCADDLHGLGMSSEDIVPSQASKDPVARAFYRLFVDELTELLPKLSQGEPWSSRSVGFVPHVQDGSVVEMELRTDFHPQHTETRIAPDVFCDRLFDHVCEVIAYYRALADEAQEVLDTTLPKLVEKMKTRGVW